jgi:hypothetical protein
MQVLGTILFAVQILFSRNIINGYRWLHLMAKLKINRFIFSHATLYLDDVTQGYADFLEI